jgi:hypothetical protein
VVVTNKIFCPEKYLSYYFTLLLLFKVFLETQAETSLIMQCFAYLKPKSSLPH